MVRLAVFALLVLAIWFVVLQLLRLVRSKQIDWNGVAFAIGFVALAFYLRHVTGIG